jgi:hypothetical protein
VEAGTPVGRVIAPDLGADVHASIGGLVRQVTDAFVEIQA